MESGSSASSSAHWSTIISARASSSASVISAGGFENVNVESGSTVAEATQSPGAMVPGGDLCGAWA